MSPYYFSSIVDEVRAKHQTVDVIPPPPPVVEKPVEYPAGEWLLWLAVAALSVLACYFSPNWITP